MLAANNTNNNSTNNNESLENATQKNTKNDILNFSIEPVSRYSESNKIPINQPLPDGIIFKVQIGAFKMPIPQNTFKGLSPISGEKLPNSNFTRYLVGLFKSYEGASLVRQEVKNLGYKDAFIVAYNNGKRIPLYKAKELLKSGETSSNYDLIAKNEVNAIKNRTINVQNQNTSTNNNINTTDLTKINGLLYTIQIGVYKNPVTAKQLYNLNPIYTEKTQYGFTRYTTGIYNDYNKALNDKNRIVSLGIKDAFVTAYYNGKKITPGEARNLAASNSNNLFINENPVAMQQQTANNNTNNNTVNNIKVNNIIFKVQIGAYKEQVPTNVVSNFIKIAANHKFEQKIDNNGVTIYTVGQFKNYATAQQTKNILVNEGIKDAFVVAYNGDIKITVNQALEIIKNQ